MRYKYITLHYLNINGWVEQIQPHIFQSHYILDTHSPDYTQQAFTDSARSLNM